MWICCTYLPCWVITDSWYFCPCNFLGQTSSPWIERKNIWVLLHRLVVCELTRRGTKFKKDIFRPTVKVEWGSHLWLLLCFWPCTLPLNIQKSYFHLVLWLNLLTRVVIMENTYLFAMKSVFFDYHCVLEKTSDKMQILAISKNE